MRVSPTDIRFFCDSEKHTFFIYLKENRIFAKRINDVLPMKKLLVFVVVSFFALAANAQKFVDLGLPSGTLWKNVNEINSNDSSYFFTYDEAVKSFGQQLPTKVQWAELKTYCDWSWMGGGYLVSAVNGNSIYLPALGYRYCDGHLYGKGFFTGYWTSAQCDSENAYAFCYYDEVLEMANCYLRCYGFPVRLVSNE